MKIADEESNDFSSAQFVEKVFFDKLADVEKDDKMVRSLLRSCTKVLREGKNAANAQIQILKS